MRAKFGAWILSYFVFLIILNIIGRQVKDPALLVISIILLVLFVFVFLYFLTDCLRRNKADFPTIGYGDKSVSQTFIKKAWLVTLVLSFIFGVFVIDNSIMYSGYLTGVNTERGQAWIKEEGESQPTDIRRLFFRDEITIGENYVKRKRSVKQHFLFILGIFAYNYFVRKWQKDRKKLR